jgi:hypothetical protein
MTEGLLEHMGDIRSHGYGQSKRSYSDLVLERTKGIESKKERRQNSLG